MRMTEVPRHRRATSPDDCLGQLREATRSVHEQVVCFQRAISCHRRDAETRRKPLRTPKCALPCAKRAASRSTWSWPAEEAETLACRRGEYLHSSRQATPGLPLRWSLRLPPRLRVKYPPCHSRPAWFSL